MAMPLPLIAINYYFTSNELNNRIFAPESTGEKAVFLKTFRDFMTKRGAEIVTLDTVDFQDPRVKHVLYFDYHWRLVLSDPFLRHVPRDKRALLLIEPANINPTLYYTALLRDRFHTVFTWDLNLIRKNPAYARVNVPEGAEPHAYRENSFRGIAFNDKRFLVAVSTNRWSHMPQSTYPFRRRAYQYFERAFPGQFDLYGMGWNAPRIFYEKVFGHPRLLSWRGPIENTRQAKFHTIAIYKFALCFENNASEPGYISEKIIDCFCARCVPVYYGCKEVYDLIPRDAWIDMRDFRNFDELGAFLHSIDEATYNQYIAAIDRFMQSDQFDYFSSDHFCRVIAERFGLPEAQKSG
jgi:hypothetical protein